MKTLTIEIKPTVVEYDNVYTVYDGNNKGGAIISDADLNKALEKFKEASHLVVAVKNLTEFASESGKWFVTKFIN